MARPWTWRLDFEERKRVFLWTPKAGSQSGEKSKRREAERCSSESQKRPNAEMTKGKCLPHRKQEKDYLETWGKD